jgi:hypothetical protein
MSTIEALTEQPEEYQGHCLPPAFQVTAHRHRVHPVGIVLTVDCHPQALDLSHPDHEVARLNDLTEVHLLDGVPRRLVVLLPEDERPVETWWRLRATLPDYVGAKIEQMLRVALQATHHTLLEAPDQIEVVRRFRFQSYADFYAMLFSLEAVAAKLLDRRSRPTHILTYWEHFWSIRSRNNTGLFYSLFYAQPDARRTGIVELGEQNFVGVDKAYQDYVAGLAR